MLLTCVFYVTPAFGTPFDPLPICPLSPISDGRMDVLESGFDLNMFEYVQ